MQTWLKNQVPKNEKPAILGRLTQANIWTANEATIVEKRSTMTHFWLFYVHMKKNNRSSILVDIHYA